MATFIFWLLAIVSVTASLGLVLMRRAVHCALMLAAVMLSLAVMYALQDAPFLAFVQVIVYTGAVLMLFLFVVMLVGVSASESLVEVIRGQRFWATVAGIGFLALLVAGLGNAAMGEASGLTSANAQYGGNVQGLAYLVFNRYVFVFEVTGALLITAALGAMVLAHRERVKRRSTQKELSRERIRGDHPTPMPSPGVYARHNAVDVPALLPDGSAEPLSVSEVISRRQELQGRRVEPPAEDVEEVSEIVEHGEYEPADANGAGDGAGSDER